VADDVIEQAGHRATPGSSRPSRRPTGTIEDDDLLLGCSQLQVGGPNRRLEFEAFLADSVGACLSFETEPRVDVEDEDVIGENAVEPDLVDRPHPLLTQAPGPTLIGDRRVVTPIGHHPLSGGEGWNDHLARQLGALGGEETHLGPVIASLGVVNQRPAGLTPTRGCRLVDLDRTLSTGCQRRDESRPNSALAAPIHPFQSDVLAHPRHGNQRPVRGGRD
jgi:hypothetical protein